MEHKVMDRLLAACEARGVGDVEDGLLVQIVESIDQAAVPPMFLPGRLTRALLLERKARARDERTLGHWRRHFTGEALAAHERGELTEGQASAMLGWGRVAVREAIDTARLADDPQESARKATWSEKGNAPEERSEEVLRREAAEALTEIEGRAQRALAASGLLAQRTLFPTTDPPPHCLRDLDWLAAEIGRRKLTGEPLAPVERMALFELLVGLEGLGVQVERDGARLRLPDLALSRLLPTELHLGPPTVQEVIGDMHQGLIDGGCVTAVVLDRDVVGHLCLAEIKRRTPSVELHGRTLVPSRAVVHAPVAVGFRPLREGEAAIELARIKPGDRVRGTSRAGVHECIATRVQLDHPLYGHVVWGHWGGPGSDETYIKAGEVEVLEPGAGPLTADYGSGYRQAVLDSFAGADLEQLATWSGLAERHGWTDFPASRDAAVASGGREFPWLDPWNERGPRGPEVQP